MSSYPFKVILYNPTTQKHKLLPILPQISIFGCKGNKYLGFGYDHVLDDYKCVTILQHTSDDVVGSFESQVMVYSLRADSWRRGAQDVPYYFDCPFSYWVYLEGILHWSVDDINRMPLHVVSFNLNDESFSSVPLPNFDPKRYLIAHIGVLDDCLCVMVNYVKYCDVWIMKEYNRPATWTKMFSFPRELVIRGFRPLSFSLSRKQLFLTYDSCSLASLDMGTSEITIVKFPGFPRVLYAHLCQENLHMFKGHTAKT